MRCAIELTKGAVVKNLIMTAMKGKLETAQLRSLDQCLMFSSKIWIGKTDGSIACAWGLVPPTILSERAYLWLYTDDAVIKGNEFIFVRNSQRAVEAMLQEYPYITGQCEIAATQSIRWLRWLGASFGEPAEAYVPFRIRKK